MSEKHLATIESAVFVPLLQAGVTGSVAAVIGGSLAAMSGGQFFTWAAVVGGVVFLLAWWGSVSWWRSAINPQPEQAPAVYQAEATRLKLSIDWDEGRAGLFDELRISDELFITWACGVGSGKSLGENHWTGAVNPFSKGQYHNFIDRLIFLGIVRPAGKGRSSGYELTGKGRAVCGAILARYGRDTIPPANQSYLSGGANRL